MILRPFDSFRGFAVPPWHASQSRFGPRIGFNPMYLTLSGLAGAGVAYFLDPEHGKRRRIIAWDRSTATARRIGRRLRRAGRRVKSDLQGQWQHINHGGRSHGRGTGAEDVRILESAPSVGTAEFRQTPQGQGSDFESGRAA